MIFTLLSQKSVVLIKTMRFLMLIKKWLTFETYLCNQSLSLKHSNKHKDMEINTIHFKHACLWNSSVTFYHFSNLITED